MKRDMLQFYDSHSFYANHDWIGEIKSIQGMNKWDADNLNDSIINKEDTKLILVATRYINGICRYRCVGNIHDVKYKIEEVFNARNDGYNYVTIFGNPGTISFRGQYELLRHTNIFVGVHGAVYLMTSLIMDVNTLKFEITMRHTKEKTQVGGGHSGEVVSMFGGLNHYQDYYCETCIGKADPPGDINITDLVDHLLKAYDQRVSSYLS